MTHIEKIDALPKLQDANLAEYLQFLELNRLFFIDEVRDWLNLLLKEDISMSKFVENFNVKLFNQYKAGRLKADEEKDSRIKELEDGLVKAVELIRAWHDMPTSSVKFPKEQLDNIWKIYYEQAPEMKPIKQLLNKQQ